MIIEAIVKIELKSNGTWKICDLKPVSDTKPPENGHRNRNKPLGRVERHFANRDRIRKKELRNDPGSLTTVQNVERLIVIS